MDRWHEGDDDRHDHPRARWSLGAVTEEIGTAQYLSRLLSDRIALELIPVIVFVTSAAMAFATGTSWGTMAIMLPLVIPLTVALGGAATYPGGEQAGILLGATGSVLAGAIFGDHCSPISDTRYSRPRLRGATTWITSVPSCRTRFSLRS